MTPERQRSRRADAALLALLALGAASERAALVLAGCVLMAASAAGQALPEVPGLDHVRAFQARAALAEAESSARELRACIEAEEGTESLAAARVTGVLVEVLLSRRGRERIEEARTLGMQALAVHEAVLGPLHPEVGRIATALGLVERALGNHESARGYHERALASIERSLGPEHLHAGIALTNLGTALFDLKDLSGAREKYERALSIREKTQGADHLDVAGGLVGLAQVARATGDREAAIRHLERVLAIREKALGPEHQQVAWTLSLLGIIAYERADHATARAYHERALALRERLLGPEHADVVASINNLGNVARSAGDPELARRHLERALAIQQRTLPPGDAGLAMTLVNLGTVHLDLGNLPAARAALESAAAIQRETPGPRTAELATTLNNLGLVASRAGDLAAARTHHEEALAIRESALHANHPDLAASWTNLGTVARDEGDHARARACYERALAINTKAHGPKHPRTAASLSNLGLVAAAEGDRAVARDFYERALAIDEEALGPGHHAVATTLSNLGTLAHDAGDHEAAQRFDARALAIIEAALGADHPDAATPHVNLAASFHARGDLAATQAHAERALAIREAALGPEHPAVAICAYTLGLVASDRGDAGTATALFERALAVREKALGPSHPDVIRPLRELSRLQHDAGDRVAALALALRAESVGRENARLAVRTLDERRALGYAAHRPGGLDLVIKAALDSDDATVVRRAWDAVARSRALVLDELGARRIAEDVLARAGDGAVAKEAAVRAETVANASRRLANLTIAGPRDEPPERFRAMLDAARAEKEQAERALAEVSSAFRQAQATASAGLEDVLRELGPRSALVAYVRGDPKARTGDDSPRPPGRDPGAPASLHAADADPPAAYAAFVIGPAPAEPALVALGDAAPIDALVSAWRAVVASPAATAADAAAAGLALRERAWDPLRRHLEGARRIFVVPVGTLHLINFAALPADSGGWMVEGPAVHVLSAERDLVPALSSSPAAGGLLALGGPDYDAGAPPAAPGAPRPITVLASRLATRRGAPPCASFERMRFAGLAEAAREAAGVASTWSAASRRNPAPRTSGAGAQVLRLSGPQATEDAFKAAAPGRRVLHVATHGFFLGGACDDAREEQSAVRSVSPARADEDRASIGAHPLLLSGLALAGANRRGDATPEEEDGILTAEEVASLDLSSCEWAVLSACGTGLGDVRAGEGVLGLERAFRVAGARTVIMSLWSVDDEATRQWMRELYRARLERKLDTAECVREASLAVLRDRRAKGEGDSPFWWGAFVASGDWR